jgi:radical SAM superfamily enzyme YgiQ (UPF0313 family)
VRITLIRPRFAEGYQTQARMEPLALGILAALTPPEHRVRVVDERIEPVDLEAPADLVALSVCTFSARRGYALADAFRARGVPVVLGGFHPTLAPEEAAAHADAVAVGDAEHTWPRLLADAAAGRLGARYGDAASGPALGVPPDRAAFRGKGYLPIRLVQYGRGCPRACEFCSIRAFYGGGVRHRPVEEVVAELSGPGPRRVLFVDDNLLGDRAAFRALLEAITPLRLRWSSQLDLSLADDPALLALARRSGCQAVTIGLESLSEENLRQMGKGWNHAAGFAARLGALRRAGIMVYGTFVFGYDQDDPATIRRTLAFALAERLFVANFNPLMPFPGTPLLARLRAEGRLVHDRWWLTPGHRWHDALVRPRRMTADELTDGCRAARQAFHGLGAIGRRLFSRAHLASLDNLVVYLAANLVSRRDIQAKARLGPGA